MCRPPGFVIIFFLVPVAYATGKYVSPSGLRNQEVMLGSGFTPLTGDRLHGTIWGKF